MSLVPDGVSYATIGVVTWFSYDYALNQTVPPNSAYMFSQNLYLHVRAVGTDPPGTARVRLADSNGFFSNTEFITSVPFTYDLKLAPNNPILSVPPGPPHSSHQCGLASLSVNGIPLPTPLAYGNDNWGWRTAAGPELYDLASGGATLIGQVYSSGDTLTSTLSFDAQFVAGPVASADVSEWWYYGQNREDSRSSDFPAAHVAGRLWTYTLGGAAIFDSPPVIGGDGTLYTVAQDNSTRAHDPLTGTERWQVPTPGVGLLGGPTVGPTGIVYVANSTAPYQLYAVQDNGATGNNQWTLPLGDPVFSPPAVGYDGTVYVATTTTLYAVLDTGPAPLVKWTLPIGSISPMAISAGGTLYVVDPTGVLSAITDTVIAGTVNWSAATGNNQVCGPVIGPDGTLYAYLNGPSGIAALQDNGGSFTLLWAAGLPAVSTNNFAVSASKVLYLALQDGNLYAIQDNGATATLNWSFACGCYYSAPAVASDNVVYLACTNAPLAGRYIALQDNGASATQLWSFSTGQTIGYGSSPTLAEDGTVYCPTTGTKLFAINETAPVSPQIDCTSLTNASFTVFDAGGTPLTGTLDTDITFDTSSIGFTPGDQFYVQFSVDPLASPSDIVVYPARPDRTAGGLVTVNAADLTIDPSLLPFFDNPVGTQDLVLKSNAYNRIQNDINSQAPSLYSLYDPVSAVTFTGTFPCLGTAGPGSQRAVLAAGTEYQVQFSPRPYPLAGSSIASLGSQETIYPPKFVNGRFVVGFGTLAEAGAVAGADNDNTDYFTQAALVNTIDNDAYCRFESQASASLLSQYGFRDTTLGTWIVIPSFPFGREPLANPFDTFVFARGTVFEASDGAQFSAPITVGAGLTLNGAGYPGSVTAAIGGASLDLHLLPTRVFDDPSQADPGQPAADVSGVGPWTVPLYFGLQYGGSPKAVEVDADYGGTTADTGPGTPAAWNDGAAGRVYTVNGSPFANNGLIGTTVTIPATQPLGSYRFAIRVTDSLGRQYTYVWSTLVTLVPAPPAWQEFIADPGPNSSSTYTSFTLVNGNPAITYIADTGVYYVRAADAMGTTWNSAIQIGGPGFVVAPSIVVANGNPAVCWCDLSASTDLIYRRATDANGTAWGAPLTVGPCSAAASWTSMVIVNNNPAICYAGPGGLLFRRAQNTSGTTWAAANAIDPVIVAELSLEIINGNPAVAYYQNSAGTQLRYCRSSSVTGAAWPAPVTVDTGSNVGRYPSLKAVNGNPGISYQNGAAGLKFVRATNANGSTWGVPQLIDGAPQSGQFTSLDIIGGNPAISYYEGGLFGDLRYIAATNASGSAWSASVAVVSANDTGWYTCLSPLSTGAPGISYINNTDDTVRFSVFF